MEFINNQPIIRVSRNPLKFRQLFVGLFIRDSCLNYMTCTDHNQNGSELLVEAVTRVLKKNNA